MIKFSAIWNPKKITKSKNNNSISFIQPKTGISPFLGIPKSSSKKTSKINMDWYQAKARYPKMNPYADADRDGVPNIMDCKPFNKKRHGPIQSVINPAIQAAQKGAASAMAPITAIAKPLAKKIASAVSQKTGGVTPAVVVKSPNKSPSSPAPAVPKTSTGIKSPERYSPPVKPTPTPSVSVPTTKIPSSPTKVSDKGFYRAPSITAPIQGRIMDPGFDKKPGILPPRPIDPGFDIKPNPPRPYPPFGNPFQPTPPPKQPRPIPGPGIPMPYPLNKEKPRMIFLDKRQPL